MQKYAEILGRFNSIANNPGEQFDRLLADRKRVVGCMTYFCPEELVYAAGMVPFGIWGADMEAAESKRWFPAFICSVLQTALELGIKGAYNGMTAVIIPKLCDSLKCMGANWERAVPGIPVINLTHAQNRRIDAGIEFTASQYRAVLAELINLGGKAADGDDVASAIGLLNKRRGLMRTFVQLATVHPDIVTPGSRNDVIKSSYFMEADSYNSLISELNEALRCLPEPKWDGHRIVTTGILADSPELLRIFKENSIMIAADQVMHESVSFREDVETVGDPFVGLARRVAAIEGASVLYDPGKRRAHELLRLVRSASADGVIFVLTKFCDPEEYDYVPVKKLLEENRVPCLLLEVDRQASGFEQIRSAVEAFTGILGRAVSTDRALSSQPST